MATRANMNGEHTAHPPGPGSSQNNQNHHPHPSSGHHHHPQQRRYLQDDYYYPRSSSAASFKGCCCCLFLLMTFLALLVLAVVLIIVLALKPKKPQFDLQQVAVQYVGITTGPSPTTTGASLTLSIRMLFTAVNPNKVGIKYSESRFYVMYKGVPLGVATVPGFYQPAHSVRQVETTVGVDRVNLLPANAADLVKDASLNDRVELRITGDVGAKIRILDITSPRVQVAVDCAIVISPRKQSLTYKQCGVDSLSV
ncbi:PREDICTED: uncharacterized protein LOC104588729 [Nelumbo nucifera]|uniref:Uncharacterized protein LOC104588729 n=1 Tax=Nelumbo nucifera TaxID=4432 RepID=A0A1U7YZL4_NELNU|nr:PREDICTED: uncharacterized protein LOC104588729 [Nelumbo nucifera]